MNHSKVSVIILNWNGLHDTIECLESLRNITYPAYDVVVVDNDSKGDDVRVLREKFGDYVHLIENDRNYGFAEGNNIGMRFALQNSNPDYILLLNNDTVVDAEFLSELVKTAGSGENIGAVQSKLLRKDNVNIIDSAGQQIFSDGTGREIGSDSIDDGAFDSVHEVFGPCAALALFKSSVLRNVGLFDKRFFILLEDADLSWRMRLYGYDTFFVPSSRVYHRGGISRGINATISTRNIFSYYACKNRLFLVVKYFPPNLIIKFLPFHCLSLLQAMYYGRKIGAPGSLMKGLFGAFVERRGSTQCRSSVRRVQQQWITQKPLREVYVYYLHRALELIKLLSQSLC